MDRKVEICGICSRGREEHTVAEREGAVHHQFGILKSLPLPDDAPKQSPRERGPAQVMMPGDPVLRMLLVRQGLITPDQLEATEAELRSLGVLRHDSRGNQED